MQLQKLTDEFLQKHQCEVLKIDIPAAYAAMMYCLQYETSVKGKWYQEWRDTFIALLDSVEQINKEINRRMVP